MENIILKVLRNVLHMIKEKTKNLPSYGYIRVKSNAISTSRSILERAVLFEGFTEVKTSSSIDTKEKVENKLCQKVKKKF
jgi:hypothetical protein